MTGLPVPQGALVLPSMSDAAIEKVCVLERAILARPQVPIFTCHLLHAGTYCRTIMIPAGVAITGVLVKAPTVLIAQGEATICIGDEEIEVSGYMVVPARAGRKQAFFAHTDFYLTMLFPTTARSVEEAEHEFTDEFDLLASHRDEQFNHVLITGE